MTQKKTIGIYGGSLRKTTGSGRSANALYNILTSRGHNVVFFDVDNELSQGKIIPREYLFEKVHFGEYSPEQVEERFPRISVDSLDTLLFRHDPPNDAESIQRIIEAYPDAQYINDPNIVLNMDKKYMQKIAAIDPSFVPETYFSSDSTQIKSYIQEFGDTILKPLNESGGNNIYKVSPSDENLEQRIGELTKDNTEIVVQKFLPEVSNGDKRVIYLNGEVMGQYNRIPQEGSYIANLDKKGKIAEAPLTRQEKHIIKRITPALRKDGIYFAGLYFIGDKLTEINVANPGFSELVNNGQVEFLATELEGLMHVEPERTTTYSIMGFSSPLQPAAGVSFF